MTANPRRLGRAIGLTDRRSERGVLDRLIDAVRAGESRVLVVRGDPGVGKTALLEYLAGRASRVPGGARGGRAVGDGAGVRRAASAVRADAGPPGSAAGAAARRAADRVRHEPPGRRRTGSWSAWPC